MFVIELTYTAPLAEIDAAMRAHMAFLNKYYATGTFLASGRKIWRDFFDRGRLHIETDERRVDGTPVPIEGDYLCFYDAGGRITGHFGIQRDVSQRHIVERALRQYNRRLQVLHDIHLDILGSRSPHEIAQATIRHIRSLIPCRREIGRAHV